MSCLGFPGHTEDIDLHSAGEHGKESQRELHYEYDTRGGGVSLDGCMQKGLGSREQDG